MNNKELTATINKFTDYFIFIFKKNLPSDDQQFAAVSSIYRKRCLNYEPKNLFYLFFVFFWIKELYLSHFLHKSFHYFLIEICSIWKYTREIFHVVAHFFWKLFYACKIFFFALYIYIFNFTFFLIFTIQMIGILNDMVFNLHLIPLDRLLTSLVLHPTDDGATEIAMLIIHSLVYLFLRLYSYITVYRFKVYKNLMESKKHLSYLFSFACSFTCCVKEMKFQYCFRSVRILICIIELPPWCT